VRLGYDGNGQRVLKQVGDASPEVSSTRARLGHC